MKMIRPVVCSGPKQCFSGTGEEVTTECAAANADCCTGNSACVWQGTEIEVCEGSCNGDHACFRPQGRLFVDSNSCNGSGACDGTSGAVSSNCCNGRRACEYLHGDVSTHSCNAENACWYNSGSPFLLIGAGSCNGILACERVHNVGWNSCNGKSACYHSEATILESSCNADSACYTATGYIGRGSCSEDWSCYNKTHIEDCDGDRTRSFDYGSGDCHVIPTVAPSVAPSFCPTNTPSSGPVEAPTSSSMSGWTADLVVPNMYCSKDQDRALNTDGADGFWFDSVEACAEATWKASACGEYFYYTEGGGQCKCATDGCRARGASIYHSTYMAKRRPLVDGV